ncbi:MAG: hypothetical protein FWE13_01645 [Firmicutes bacterium]|nr:hypothetical protein [Bacillota bacterium]
MEVIKIKSKNKKNKLVLVTIIMLSISLFFVGCFWQDSRVVYTECGFRLSRLTGTGQMGHTFIAQKYLGDNLDITIPIEHNGYTITTLGERLAIPRHFRLANQVEKITIQSNIIQFNGIVGLEEATPLQLKEIYVTSDNTNYKSINGVLYRISDGVLAFYPPAKQNLSYVLPIAGVQYHSESRLLRHVLNNRYLQNLFIPWNEVLRIEFNLSALQNIFVPNSLVGAYRLHFRDFGLEDLVQPLPRNWQELV